MTVSRRAFVRILGGTGAALGVGVPLLSGMAGSQSTGAFLPSRLPLPEPFTLPFRVPPVLRPTKAGRYSIVQRAAVAEILPGVRTPIWGYNGTFPGPTLVSRSGLPITVTHRNELPVPVVVHLHGGHTPAEHDGFPTDLILPTRSAPAMNGPDVSGHAMGGHETGAHEMGAHETGGHVTHGQRDYVYPMEQRAATLWYHDHRMGFTGAGVWRGLAGFHLVTDPKEDALGLPRGDRDLPVMITDRSFDADGSFRYPSLDPTLLKEPGVRNPYGSGVLGDVILVNGVPWPIARVPAARHRIRLLNASNARRYRLVLNPPPPGGPGIVQIGTDGGLLPRPLPHEAVELAPAQRFDVVIDFGRYRPGQSVTIRNEFGDGRTRDIMRFTITAAGTDTSRIPDRLAAPPDLDPKDPATIREFRFQHKNMHGLAGWAINGLPYQPDHDFARPRLGTTEIWRLTSDFHHPIHLHLAHFQVLSRGLKGPGAYDHGWKDTIDLRPAERAEILVRFDDYPGRYVFHCHNLEHEDMAMMGNFTTLPQA